MEMDEDLLEAHRQGTSDDIKNLEFIQNLGYGAESPHLDMVLSISRICLSLTFGDSRKVVKHSAGVHGQVE